MLRPTMLRYVALACCDRLAGALGRRQLATEMFSSVARWKNVVGQKCQQMFSLAVKHKYIENSGRQFFVRESERRERVWGHNDDFSPNE